MKSLGITFLTCLLALLDVGFTTRLTISLVMHDVGAEGAGWGVILVLGFLGLISLLFIIWALLNSSYTGAKYGVKLSLAFVCLSFMGVLLSFTYLVGFIIASVVYMLVAVAALVLASWTSTELKMKEDETSVTS